MPRLSHLLLLLAAALVWTGCDNGPRGTLSDDDDGLNCNVDTDALVEGANRGSITALTDPPLVTAQSEAVADLQDTDRVLALLVGDTPLAVPRTVLFQHEVVNLNGWAGRDLLVTFCPLTGSSLAFDRGSAGGVSFDVSGLLLYDNLVMVDDRTDESLWPQMARGAACGPRAGAELEMVPLVDLQWGRWRELHPNTRVVSLNAGDANTQGSDAQGANAQGANAQGADAQGADAQTASAKQSDDDVRGRILGIPSGRSGGPRSSGSSLAVPFTELAAPDGPVARVVDVDDGAGTVVFWTQASAAAMAFRAPDDDFTVRNGQIVDTRTQSVWAVDGRAIEGPRRSEQLTPVSTAHVAFFEAWQSFNPDTDVWRR